MVLLSLPETVIESMDVLNTYLTNQGLTGLESRFPKPDAGHRDSVNGTQLMLSVVTPPKDPFGASFSHNGDRGHFTAPLSYALSVNLSSLKALKSTGFNSTLGFTKALAGASVAELDRVRSAKSDARNHKTLMIEGAFGTSKKEADRRFRAHATTSLARGIDKLRRSCLSRQEAAKLAEAVSIDLARTDGNSSRRRRTAPRLNLTRSRTRKGRKKVYDGLETQQQSIGPDPASLKSAAYTTSREAVLHYSLPCLPDSTPRPVRQRSAAVAKAAEQMPNYKDANAVIEDNLPLVDVDELDEESDADGDVQAVQSSGITTGITDTAVFNRAKDLLMERFAKGGLPAQPVPRRDHGKTCPTATQSKQAKADGSRAALYTATDDDPVPSSSLQSDIMAMATTFE
jgi:hypothetical protein